MSQQQCAQWLRLQASHIVLVETKIIVIKDFGSDVYVGIDSVKNINRSS